MLWLRQSTAVTVSFGPAVSNTDGVTLVINLTGTGANQTENTTTGIRLSKNGGAFAARHATAGASTYDAFGNYLVPLDTTDTNTLGTLRMQFANAAAFCPLFQDFMVVNTALWDALFASSGGAIPNLVAGATNGLFIAGTNAATTITTALTTTFTGNLTGSVASVTGAVGSVTGAVGSVTGNVGGNVTGSVGSVVGAVGSVTARVTANTDQLAGQTVSAAAGVTFPSSVASPTNITAGIITTVSGNVTGSVGSVVGAVGSVTGNVGGNVTGSVGSVATAGITSASFAADTGEQSIRSNTATAGAATTITLDAGASAVNDFYKNDIIYLTGGTGVGQARFITGYVGATKVATVSAAWATNPDGTTTFAILPFDSIPGATAPTVTQIATAVWQDSTAGDFTAANSIGKSILNGVTLGTGLTINQLTTNLDKTGYALTAAYDLAKTAAQAGDAMTLTSGERNSTADALLNRDMSIGSDSGSATVRTVRQALRFLRNKWTVAASTLTVYKEDDSTSSWTATVSTDAAAVPIIGNDPAGP